ncbi:MAG: serine protease [Bacteriovoracia bacterium]
METSILHKLSSVFIHFLILSTLSTQVIASAELNQSTSTKARLPVSCAAALGTAVSAAILGVSTYFLPARTQATQEQSPVRELPDDQPKVHEAYLEPFKIDPVDPRVPAEIAAIASATVRIENEYQGGTGFLISPDGYVLTAFHVIRDYVGTTIEEVEIPYKDSVDTVGYWRAKTQTPNRQIQMDFHTQDNSVSVRKATVFFTGKGFIYSKLLYRYPRTQDNITDQDFAILKIEPKPGQTFPFLRVRLNPPGFHEDTWNIQLWNNWSRISFFEGKVGEIDEAIDAYSDAQFYPNTLYTSTRAENGMSGGPVVDDEGRVLGILFGGLKVKNEDNRYLTRATSIQFIYTEAQRVLGVDQARRIFERSLP